jgi:hypothetical protein|tara:strand:- start:2376 stop:2582 length:207 start_codon:yes stop_codon:yes gene_type:complete
MNVNDIIDYEQGKLNDAQTLKLFSSLVRSGAVWSLQGHYGRTASALIQDGWIDSDGCITEKAELNGLT